MAIDTNNEKFSLISYNQPFSPPLPISADGLDQADNQQLIWQYAGILWESETPSEQQMPIISDGGIHNAIFHGLVISG